MFTVLRYKATGEPIGFLEGVFRERDKVGEFLVYIDRRWRRRRSALAGMAMFPKYLFDSFPIRKIYCHAYDYNQESIRLMRSGGFVEEGRFREFVWWRDRYWDMHVLALSRETWRAGERGEGPFGRVLKAAGLLRPASKDDLSSEPEN